MVKPRRDVDDAIASMTAEHLRCRDYGHAWTPFDAFRIRGGFDQRMRCRDCGTIRRRVLDRRGEVITSSYVYVDGYLIEGIGRLVGADRGRVRLASLLSGTVHDGPSDGR